MRGTSGDAEGQAAEEAADVSEVVDVDDGGKVGGNADEEIEARKLDDGAAEALELRPGDGELVIGEQGR